MSYTMTQWQNGQEPAINAENLNKIERGIYDAHQTAKGKYSKPSLGIPKNDLAESVKNSLDNADSALQDDDVDSALSLISTNPVQNKVITNKIASTDRRLNALYNLTQGQAWDFDRDDNNAYSVDVPSGAKYASVDMVGGKSVAWNQLCKTDDYNYSANGITVTRTAGTGITNIVVSDNVTGNVQYIASPIKSMGGHKYALIVDKPLVNGMELYISYVSNTESVRGSYPAPKNQAAIANVVNTNGVLYMYIGATTPAGTYEYNIQLFDLTQMFGSTIADYIYSLEQSQAGAGVAWFKQMFPADYYPYCEPTIISSQTDRVDVRGKNLFNPQILVDLGWTQNGDDFYGDDSKIIGKILWENKNQIASQFVLSWDYKYAEGATNQGTFFVIRYTDDTSTIARPSDIPTSEYGHYTFVTDSNKTVKEIITSYGGRSYNTHLKNIQLELNETETAYSPYSLQQITTNFPVLNSAGSVYDYIDLNEGKLHQKVGVVDLGTLNWIYDGDEIFRAFIFTAKFKGLGICSKYQVVQVASWTQIGDKQMAVTNSQDSPILRIHDSSMGTDAATFKATMSGVMLVYELAEEIITDIEIPTELSDWLTVEAGGSITFHNVDDGKRLLIPSTEEYLVKLSEVISNG